MQKNTKKKQPDNSQEIQCKVLYEKKWLKKNNDNKVKLKKDTYCLQNNKMLQNNIYQMHTNV